MKEQINPTPENSGEEKELPVPEHTVGGEGQPACPSIFDKPEADRYKTKTKGVRKKGSRQIRNIVIALVLCVTIGFSASGVCFLLYGQWNPFAYLADYLGEEESTASTASEEEEQQLIFDYSAYGDDSADTATMALGGIKNILVINQQDTYSLESYWGTETVVDESTYETSEVEVLKWLITSVEDKDVEGVRFNPSTVGFIISDLLKISYDSVYAQDGNEEIPQGSMTYFEECGIDDSQNRLVITFGNGAKVTVIVGDPTPTGNNYFLAVENDPGQDVSALGAPVEDNRIYKVTADTVTYFMKEASYYVNKEIITMVEQADSTYTEEGDEIEDPYFISGALSYFDALSISGLSYEKDFVFEIVEENRPGYDSIYLMTSPYTQNVDLSAMETLLAPVADGLSATGCLVMKASSADMAKYGLDEPACQVRYVVKDVEYILKIGRQVDKENDTYAVMVNGNPSIMEISSASIAFMTYDEADFASDTLYSCDITEIKSLQVTMSDGTDHLFRLSHGTDSDGNATLSVTTRNGKAVEEEPFRDMYVDLLSLTSFTNVTDGKDASTPYMTITLTYNEYDQVDVIRLSPYTDRRYFMSLNGMGSTVVLSTAVDALAESVLGLVK